MDPVNQECPCFLKDALPDGFYFMYRGLILFYYGRDYSVLGKSFIYVIKPSCLDFARSMGFSWITRSHLRTQIKWADSVSSICSSLAAPAPVRVSRLSSPFGLGRSSFTRVTACHVATYYYVGFCYIMLCRCPDAIHVFVQNFLSVANAACNTASLGLLVGGLCYIIFSGLLRPRPLCNAP